MTSTITRGLLGLFSLLMVLLASSLAQAAPKTYALSVAKSGTGSGTVTSSPAGITCGSTCKVNFKKKAKVTLTAAATAGSAFNGWTGACTGTANTCTVTMSQAQMVSADFALAKLKLTVSKSGSGTGTITSSPVGIDCGATCAFDFNAHASVILTAHPAAGSAFQGWSGACSGMAATCTVTLNQAKNLYAKFSAPSTTTYQYDANGNLTYVTDPLGNTRQIQYDNLDQAIRQLEPHPNTTGSTLGQIDIDYDHLGQITRITDPRNLTTDYQVDNVGNVVSQTSPDTGVTHFTYDDAGNLKTRTDARGKTTTYSYDSQNRLMQTVDEDQTINYNWDNCTHGIGRLCSLANADVTLSFSYDAHGRITAKSQTVGAITLSISHSYNALGQLEQTITASGQTIGYVWLNGRLGAITLNGQPLISQIVYEPDRQIGGWTWSNGALSERQYDLAGRPVAISLGFDVQSLLPDTRNYSYDAAGRITSILDDINASVDQNYVYDGLDRLTTSQQGAFTVSSFDYAYDLSGNRIIKIPNNSATENHSIDPGSNRLQQKTGTQTVNYSYDPAGNLLSDGTTSFSYNAQGRRISGTAANLNATYSYNPLGQRVSKTVNGTTTHFVYDQQGRLLGEYNAIGQLIQETVWLGELPIAVLKPATSPGAAIDSFYIHADHLGTPRQITRPTDNKVLWTWESDAFGDSLPNQNPSGLGEFSFNLRFPGQYYDVETGLHYNYFRDYDPGTGRYIESDPIGLAGGINTYSYVNNNSLNRIDPLGLYTEVIIWQPVTWTSSSFGHVSGNINGQNWSFTPNGWDTKYPQANDYAAAQSNFRSGAGVKLNLTLQQEANLKSCLKSKGSYRISSNNCGTPWKNCLKEIGADIGNSFFPVNIGNDLLNSPYFEGSTFYPGPSRPIFSDAPWAR